MQTVDCNVDLNDNRIYSCGVLDPYVAVLKLFLITEERKNCPPYCCCFGFVLCSTTGVVVIIIYYYYCFTTILLIEIQINRQ